ncbi:sacI homology domain-containing protein [Ditylenchus destructor]|uniref:SacI homology domain-containing protein n=1 Tax=Ditylenchus destructor TaxID=166010 RepID=A0AAD4QXZ1_9BILA|nr:sacI homology domain-containing protein [Ditylenchus destructor]
MKLYSLSVYETPTHFYVIGSDASEQKFSTLKIDRTSERDFIVGEPDHTYSKSDIGELLATVSSSSIVTPTEKWNKRSTSGNSGLLRTVDKAYGILGAVRFLGGYYLLIVTKAKVVVTLGYHALYKIEDVSMIYIPVVGVPSSHPEELKYAKLFQSVDFTTNFYFAYTYDLSHTLQENVLAEKNLSFNKNTYNFETMAGEEKFVWNNFLLKPFRDNLVSDKWTLEIVHGYIGYHIVELPCAKLCLTLIARRSAEFAGTRFLKRGTNFKGSVANDVETEQIVWDMSSSPDFSTGKFTAYVQRRGSVPLFWSQDSANRGVMVKPPIMVDLIEPNALTTAAHFRDLRRKYGHPIVVMNLVKKREKRHNENTVKYLNMFRKPGKCIDYISFDVSRCHKTEQVLKKLETLGIRSIMSHGWFQSFPQLRARETRRHWLLADGYEPVYSSDGTMILQHGISRTNCVDCLDRTNVAQFGIGKVALGFQLHAMGYIEEPAIDLSTEVCRVLEEIYDEHGDTLAWQYAGSQLVHTIKTYKKTAVFQERSRDVFQTISRYYSNTFSDFEKQDGVNLFLGIFRLDVVLKVH